MEKIVNLESKEIPKPHNKVQENNVVIGEVTTIISSFLWKILLILLKTFLIPL